MTGKVAILNPKTGEYFYPERTEPVVKHQPKRRRLAEFDKGGKRGSD